MDWKNCIKTRTVKEVSKDEGMIKSLLETSNNKEKSELMLSLSEITIEAKISLVYDSLREVLEALAYNTEVVIRIKR